MENVKIKGYILETVDNQLRDNEPKCVNETFKKLITRGYKEKEAKEMIGAILIEEMYDVMKNQQPFNEERYSSKLSTLPDYTCEAIEEENFKNQIIQRPMRNENKIGRNATCSCGSGKKYKMCCGK